MPTEGSILPNLSLNLSNDPYNDLTDNSDDNNLGFNLNDDDDEEELNEGGSGDVKIITFTRKEVLEQLQINNKVFDGADLRKANLTKLDLSGCSFIDTNCSYVNFKDSNLENCDFSRASLWNANLEGTNLSHTNFQDADLDYTKMRGATMYKANIKRANLPTDLIPRDEIMRSIQEGTKINR